MNALNALPEGRLVFQNEACLVINKQSGESSESPGFRPDALKPPGLKSGEKFPVPVHRLDMPVTGCLLLAKTPQAAAFLNAAFAAGPGCIHSPVEKRYWAIIEKPDANAFPEKAELVHWISFNTAKNKSFAHNQDGHGRKKSVLRYNVKGTGTNYLFMEIELVTGRHHQIRAQLAALGLRIKGDLKYGARRSEKSGGIRLHAYSLAFPNPLRPGELLEVKTLPPVMDNLWAAFSAAAV